MKTAVILLNNECLYRKVIDFGDDISFGSHKKDDVNVSDFKHKQITVKYVNQGIILNAKETYSVFYKSVPMENVIMLDEDNGTCMYFTTNIAEIPKKIELPYNTIISFGRKFDGNEVVLNLPFVSSHHFRMIVEGGAVRVEDNDSSNGLYLNGKRISIGKMKSGDTLSILSINIKLINNTLVFEGIGNSNFAVRNIKDTHINNSANSSVKNDEDNQLYFHKSPRMQDVLPKEDIILSQPPTKGQKYEKMRGSSAMLLSTGAMAGVSFLTSAVSPALLLARGAGMISPIANMASSSSNNKRRKKNLEQYTRERREKYGAYIDDQKAKIGAIADVQRSILTKENPTPQEGMKTVFQLKRTLWERLPNDRDFLDVRVGMGYDNLCVNVKSRAAANGFKMEDDEVEELCEQIIEETRIVDNIPRRIPLLHYNSVGFVGDRSKTISLVRNMLVSLTAHHSFEDVRLMCIFDEEEREFWEPIKWLPHVWDEDQQHRMIAYDQENADNILNTLIDMLSTRQRDLADTSNYRNKSIPNPYYVVLFASKKAIENSMIMNYLFSNKPEMGVTSLFMFNDYYQLPPECRCIVDLMTNPCVYEREEANIKYYFTPDPVITDSEFDSFTRRMSAIHLEGFAKKAGLPKAITFLEGYGVTTVEQLDILRRWEEGKTYNSLAAPIGKLAGDVTFSLDIHEKAHGPHGLVAGTTGSGKSEILQAWILSMACTFHPHEVAFVLIDYKGGGMANLLEPLPHVVGKITNIGSNINRSMVSLNSELKRRQVIFDEYGVNHIDKYQKLYKQGSATEPLPHLIIVADEFAELKKEEPDFMSALIKAARVGRSLGVHLVLATQKPGGVVDEQIQSNSRFRLCLKVQDATDSREMIKRPDAARIVQSGRSFIRVGEDEYFDLFQSYWSGAPYYGAQQVKVDDENQVRIIAEDGQRINPMSGKIRKKKSDLDEITAVVRHIVEVSERAGIKAVNGPWLPELPDDLTIDKLEMNNIGFDGHTWRGRPEWLKIPVGMYDLPVAQEQGVQYIDFLNNGHHAVYGAPGIGKTTFLKTIITSLGRFYTPKDINIYAIDCGGWGLSIFNSMPHVGGVALDCEEEKIVKLEKMIRDEFTRRKKLFLNSSVSSLTAYRENVDSNLPAIVLVVDNIVSLFELFPDIENFLIKVASEGTTYGIYLVYAANSTTGVRFKVVQNMKGAIAFELTDRGDYANIVGRLEGQTLPKIQGRAFAKGNPPIEFQSALYANGDNDRDRALDLQQMFQKMNEAWSGVLPPEIPVMPEKVSLDIITPKYSNRYKIPLGLNYSEIAPAYVDLSTNYTLIVSGGASAGKSKYLCNIASMISEKNSDAISYIFDTEKSGLGKLKDAAHSYSMESDDAAVSEALKEIVNHLNERKNAQNAARKENPNNFDEKAFINDYPLICIYIDDLSSFVNAVSNANRDSMNRICRLAQDLGVLVFAAGRIDDIAKNNEMEPLTRTIVSYQNGLALTGTPNQHLFFKNNLKYNEKDTELEAGSGYFFTNGQCITIKYIQ